MYRVITSCLSLVLLLLTAVLGASSVYAQEIEPAFSAIAEGVIGDNELGIKSGERFRTELMIDPGLTPTLSVSTPDVLRFIDPWRWHWIVGTPWDWLRGFIILIPRLPIPGPDPGPLTIEAVFDDSQDMVMDMPGIPSLPRGTSFVTKLMFEAESAFFKQGRLPTMDEMNGLFVRDGSSFEILGPDGKSFLRGSIDVLKATPSEPPCKGDLDEDGDVDQSDVRLFRSDFGRLECPLM